MYIALITYLGKQELKQQQDYTEEERRAQSGRDGKLKYDFIDSEVLPKYLEGIQESS